MLLSNEVSMRDFGQIACWLTSANTVNQELYAKCLGYPVIKQTKKITRLISIYSILWYSAPSYIKRVILYTASTILKVCTQWQCCVCIIDLPDSSKYNDGLGRSYLIVVPEMENWSFYQYAFTRIGKLNSSFPSWLNFSSFHDDVICFKNGNDFVTKIASSLAAMEVYLRNMKCRYLCDMSKLTAFKIS